MNLLKKILVLTFTSAFFFSCTSTKRISKPVLSFEELLESSRLNFERIKSYSGNGTIDLNLKSLKINLQFSISAKKPEQALIDLYGPLGIDVGSLFLNDDSIVVYNAFQDKVILTRFSSERFKDFNSVEIDKNFIYALLFSYVDQNKIESDSSLLLNNESEFTLIKFLKERRLEFTYDKLSRTLKEIQVFENSVEPVFKINFLKYKNYNEINFPQVISFLNLKTNESISLNFKKFEFNKLEEDLNFELPEDVEIIRW